MGAALVSEKTTGKHFEMSIFCAVRCCGVDVWLSLFVWAECVFVYVLLNLIVSRMLTYKLCHVDTAKLGFVKAGLICCLLSLTTI